MMAKGFPRGCGELHELGECVRCDRFREWLDESPVKNLDDLEQSSLEVKRRYMPREEAATFGQLAAKRITGQRRRPEGESEDATE